jgi:ribosomal protein L29
MKTRELRKKKDDELRKRLDEIDNELPHVRFRNKGAMEEDTAKLHNLKKEKARILTILCERARSAP